MSAPIIAKIEPYWKAIAGFLAPIIPTILAAVQDGSVGGSAITVSEWITIVGAAVGTSAIVYAVPNKDRTASHQDESVQPPLQDEPPMDDDDLLFP